MKKKKELKENEEHSNIDLINELSTDEGKEKFRRLISCTFSVKYVDEFISLMEALGFVELGGFEYLGRRDADYSMAIDLDESYRLHARVYIIQNNVFVLVHHEPKATEDIKLHIKGYFDRIIYAILKKEEKESDEGNSELDDELDIEAGGDGKEKVELSNYEKGTEIYITMIKEKVPNFYKKINTKITEEDLSLWRDFIGQIDHLTQEELIIENLYESSRLIPPFSQIRNTCIKLFQYFHFETEPAWDLEVTASNKYFLAKTTYAKHPFTILVLTEDFSEEILRTTGLLRAKYNPKFTILITPDISIFGPESDDIAPEGIDIPEFNEQKTKELIDFFRDSEISIIPVSIIIEIFKYNLRQPLRLTHFAFLFNKKGILNLDDFNEIIKKENSFEIFVSDVFKVFDILKEIEKESWISIKNIEKNTKNKGIEIDKTELMNILIFMENPLLGLIESKKQKRKDFRILPHLSQEDIEVKSEKMQNMLKQYYSDHM